MPVTHTYTHARANLRDEIITRNLFKIANYRGGVLACRRVGNNRASLLRERLTGYTADKRERRAHRRALDVNFTAIESRRASSAQSCSDLRRGEVARFFWKKEPTSPVSRARAEFLRSSRRKLSSSRNECLLLRMTRSLSDSISYFVIWFESRFECESHSHYVNVVHARRKSSSVDVFCVLPWRAAGARSSSQGLAW